MLKLSRTLRDFQFIKIERALLDICVETTTIATTFGMYFGYKKQSTRFQFLDNLFISKLLKLLLRIFLDLLIIFL